MIVDFKHINNAFADYDISKNHGLVVKDGKSYKVIERGSKEANQKISLGLVLKSLFTEIQKKERTDVELQKALQISKYFVDKTPCGNSIFSKIKNAFLRLSNWIEGNGFKTNLELASEIKNYIHAKEKIEGFIPADFWTSISKNRDTKLDPLFKTDKTFEIVQENYKNFCSKVAASPKLDYTTPPANSSIPPNIHFIWMGSPVPKKEQEIIETWRKMHPGWTIKIWTDADIEGFNWKNRKAFDEARAAKCWAEAADTWRYEILHEQGGIYSDTDVVCFKSFNDLISHDVNFFACQESNVVNPWFRVGKPLYLCNAVMGAAKGSPVMKYCIDNLRPRSEPRIKDDSRLDLLYRTGTVLFSTACDAALHSPGKENVIVLPSSYFYPLPWFADLRHKKMSRDEIRAKYVEKESLAVHLWDGSW